MRSVFTIPFILLGAMLATQAMAQSESSEEELHHTTCTPEEYFDCLNGVTTSVSNTATVRLLGDKTSRRLRESSEETEGFAAYGPGTAAVYAAGDAAGGGGIEWWINYTHADFDSDFANSNGASLVYDGNIDTAMMGVHYLFTDRLLFGAAIGYEDQATRSDFNGGAADADGLLFTPYIAYLLGDHFSIDASAGYSSLEYKQSRISPNNGATINAQFDAKRWFLNANLSAFTEYSGFQLGGTLGILRVEEDQDGYTEVGDPARNKTVGDRDVTLTQLLAGVDFAYPTENFEPYGYATYRNDLSGSQGAAAGGLPNGFAAVTPDDDDEFEFGLGVRMHVIENLSAAFEGSYIVGRSDFDGWALSLTGRYQF